MRTRRGGIAIGGMAFVTAFGFLASAGPAGAQAPDEQGWWTATNTGPPPVALPVNVPNATPDVPSNGLLVEGGLQSPTAYSALVYKLSDGSVAKSLTLTVTPNSATTPNTTLKLCPLLHPDIYAEQGGQISNAPTYNCAKNVTAQASNGSFKFDISTLESDNALAVAILPTSATDRVVFNQPDQSSLDVLASDGFSSSGAGQPSPVSTGQSTSSPATQSTGGAATSVTPAVPAAEAGSSPGLAGLPPGSATPGSADSKTSGEAGGAPAASNFSTVSSIVSGGTARPLAVVLVVLALVVGGICWSGVGRAVIRRAVRDQIGQGRSGIR